MVGDQAKSSVELAKKYFDNISIDLIYGIPGLTDDDWKKNIEIAKKFKLPHISAYSLTVEQHTILKKLIDKGKLGHDFAHKYHDSSEIAKKVINRYESIIG